LFANSAYAPEYNSFLTQSEQNDATDKANSHGIAPFLGMLKQAADIHPHE